MKTSNFRYEVHIEIEFTDEELNVIELCMMSHYDARTKAAAAHGGFLYGWKNCINMMGDTTLTCSFDQIGTCAKAIEQPSSIEEDDARLRIRARLQFELKDVLDRINAETKRLHHESEYVLRYVSPEMVEKYNAESVASDSPHCPFCGSKRFPVITWEGADGLGALDGTVAQGWAGLGCEDCKSEWTENLEIRNLGLHEENCDLHRPDMLPEDIQAMEDAGWKWNDNDPKKFKWSKS